MQQMQKHPFQHHRCGESKWVQVLR